MLNAVRTRPTRYEHGARLQFMSPLSCPFLDSPRYRRSLIELRNPSLHLHTMAGEVSKRAQFASVPARPPPKFFGNTTTKDIQPTTGLPSSFKDDAEIHVQTQRSSKHRFEPHELSLAIAPTELGTSTSTTTARMLLRQKLTGVRSAMMRPNE